MRIAAEATYVRGSKFEDDVTPAVQALRQAGVEAVLCWCLSGCARSSGRAGSRLDRADLERVVCRLEAMLLLLLKHGQATRATTRRRSQFAGGAELRRRVACPASSSIAR